MMKLQLLIVPVMCVAIVLTGCDSREVERLRAENDSLRQELNTRYAVVTTMKEIKVLIDSIDISRNALHANLAEGTTYEDFEVRMKNIHSYVDQTEKKIDTIEQELKASRYEASAYVMMVDALKSELTIRADEVAVLEKQVSDYKKENRGLLVTVKLQEDALADMRNRIEAKQQELSLIEAKVSELVTNFKVSEAEAYFARGQAVEEAANRTKLAPNKKKETYREALELYKKSFALGKTEAWENISVLEKKLD